MKKIILSLLFLLSVVMTFASNAKTLYDIKEETGIPIKKLKEYLNIKPDFPPNKAIPDFNQRKLNELKDRFKGEKRAFITSITLSGMGVVFISLIIVALLIAQFRHIKTIQKKIGPSKPCRNLNNDALIAAMFTVYLHELEVEEQNKLMLTWKRTSISMWKSVSKVEMPNTAYYKERKR